jgi:hypothetical protein
MRTALPLAALVCLAGGAHAAQESALRFVDLRVQGGVVANEGMMASATIMAGDIGNKDQHVISLDADMGIVLGLRGQAGQVTADFEDGGPQNLDVTLGGGTILGGFGFYLGKHSHAELLFGYGRGIGSGTASSLGDDDNIDYYQYQGELGWYYTWSTHLQVGLTVGYTVLKIEYERYDGDVDAKIDGFDAGIALGYRF